MCDFLHCNRCYTNDMKGTRYAIGSCFHVLCQKCVKGCEKTCPVCRKSIKYVPIDSQMNAELKEMFMDPRKLIEDEFTKLSKRIEFQKNMSDHLIEHLLKEKERKKEMEVYIKKKGKDYEKKKKELENMEVWIKSAEERIRASTDENLRLKNQVEQLKEKLEESEKLEQIATNHSHIDPTFQFDRDVESELSSIGRSSSNSSFRMMSPFVVSPVPSNCSHMSDPFDLGEGDKTFFGKRLLNNSDTNSFSAAFNANFGENTPGRDITMKRNDFDIDKTSLSLEYRLTTTFDDAEAKKRETSLPIHSPKRHSQNSSKRSKNGLPMFDERERRFPSPIRELRRYASQPGVVTRKPIIPTNYLNLNPNM